jgi:hypothetical protein
MSAQPVAKDAEVSGRRAHVEPSGVAVVLRRLSKSALKL